MDRNSILSDCSEEVIHKFVANPAGCVPDALRSTTVATAFGVMNQLIDTSERCESLFKSISDKFYDLNKRIESAQKSLNGYKTKVEGKERYFVSAEIPELIEDTFEDDQEEFSYQPFDFFSLPIAKERTIHKESIPDLQCISKLLPDKSVSIESQYTSTGVLPSTKPRTASITTSTSSPPPSAPTEKKVQTVVMRATRREKGSSIQSSITPSILSSTAKRYLNQANQIRLSSNYSRSSSIFTFSSLSSGTSGSSITPASSLPSHSSSQSTKPTPTVQKPQSTMTSTASTASTASTTSTASTASTALKHLVKPQPVSTKQSPPAPSRSPAYSPESVDSDDSFRSVQSDDMSEPTKVSSPVDEITQSLPQPVKQQRAGLPPPPPPTSSIPTTRKDGTPACEPRRPPPFKSGTNASSSTPSPQEEPPRRPPPFLGDLAGAAASRQQRLEEKKKKEQPHIPPQEETPRKPLPFLGDLAGAAASRQQRIEEKKKEQPPTPSQEEPPRRPLPFLNDLAGAAASRQQRMQERSQPMSPTGSLGGGSLGGRSIRKAGTLGSRTRTTTKSERFGAGVLDMVRGDTIGRLRVVDEEGGEVPPKPTGNPLLDEIMRFDKSKLKKVDRGTSNPAPSSPTTKKPSGPTLAELFRSRLDVMQTDSESDSDSSGADFSDYKCLFSRELRTRRSSYREKIE